MSYRLLRKIADNEQRQEKAERKADDLAGQQPHALLFERLSFSFLRFHLFNWKKRHEPECRPRRQRSCFSRVSEDRTLRRGVETPPTPIGANRPNFTQKIRSIMVFLRKILKNHAKTRSRKRAKTDGHADRLFLVVLTSPYPRPARSTSEVKVRRLTSDEFFARVEHCRATVLFNK